MIPENINSPYPGLRPFNEEESLFFKGREKHISRIQELLMAERFLMVTGASGDGKSSLVYAGLLPNVRAGFLRGIFGKWEIVIIRPGNSPFKNLCSAISGIIKEFNPGEIEQKLRFGYAALIELYLNSSLFVDQNSEEFKQLDDKERNRSLRKGSNLLIVIDQFEEFFTMDMNFNKETSQPGMEALLAMNLILETARITKEKEIPVYIVCTMRSDYIGSCPAYRGLPELIGENQFFVPRLNREEIYNVIVEPALLQGNRINPRLAQRIINDLDLVNTDVLPSLQHALRRIWEFAENGNAEMDLLHYAMVGGMEAEELPVDVRTLFSDWVDHQPAYYKTLLIKTKGTKGISNVLNLHADLLFETAHQIAGINISLKQSQRIIKGVFQCLTQIDDTKAVRNRMSLADVLDVLHERTVPGYEIEKLISVFRLHGNNFIFPFTTALSDTAENVATENVLLDLTHEALIRNWKNLMTWTLEEHEKVKDLKELNTSVERWKSDGFNKSSLLSQGNYNYFVNRYPGKPPSAMWMKRYLQDHVYITDGITKKNIKEENGDNSLAAFIKRRNYYKSFFLQSREELARKRRNKKLALTAISSLLFLSIFALFYILKKNKEISLESKSNLIATIASSKLSTNPTLSFRLAEQAYKILPTLFAKTVLSEAYSNYPFYHSLDNHSGWINEIILSDDEKFIASCTDNEIIIWTITGEIIKTFNYQINTWAGENIAFSWDGKYFAFGKNNGKVGLFSLQEKKVKLLNTGWRGITTSLCFSPDSKFILAGNESGEIIRLDLNGKPINSAILHNGIISGIKASKNSGYYFSFSEKDKKVIVFDNNLKQKGTLSNLEINRWVILNFSPDGKKIAIPSISGVPKIWNIEKDEILELTGHTDQVWSAVFSPDGKNILTSSIDKTIKLWDAENGMVINTIKAHSAKIWNSVFSGDGKNLLSISDDCTGRIWDLKGNMIHVLKGHNSQINRCIFSKKTNLVITAGNDYSIKVWNLAPVEVPSLDLHFSWVDDVNFSKDGSEIITGGYDYTAKVWDKNGHLIRSIGPHKFYGIYRAGFLPGQEGYYTEDGRNTISHWSKEGILNYTFQVRNKIMNSLISFDGKYFSASGYDTETITIWNNKGEIIKEIDGGKNKVFSATDNSFYYSVKNNFYHCKLKGNTSSGDLKPIFSIDSLITEIAISNDNKNIAISDKHNNILIIKEPSIEKSPLIIKAGKHSEKIAVLKFSPDGNYIASAGHDNLIKIWNGAGDNLYTFSAHSEVINDLCFSSDSKYLLSASNDHTIKRWNLRSGILEDNYTMHKAAVVKVLFSPDDKYILSASNDQRACLIPVTTEQIVNKINVEKVRGEVDQLTPDELHSYQLPDE